MTVFTEKPTLFVVARRGDVLEKYGEAFRIRDSGSGDVRVKAPALAVRDIIVCGDTLLDAEVFALAEKRAVPIHFLTTGGKFRASVVFDFSKNVFLRTRQFQIASDPVAKLAVARSFVEAKVNNQNVVLQKMRARRRVTSDMAGVSDLEVLRGKEGAAARAYFDIWQQEALVKDPGFSFPGREKRPPTDPVNALLSFCFSLGYSEVHTQLLIAGLDPYIGFLHEQTFGHPALASDFIEPFRGPIERLVLRAINRREFDAETDFEHETGGAVKLSRAGFTKFFPKWSDFLRKESLQDDRNLTRLIEHDVRSFAQFLMGDTNGFIPFHWSK